MKDERIQICHVVLLTHCIVLRIHLELFSRLCCNVVSPSSLSLSIPTTTLNLGIPVYCSIRVCVCMHISVGLFDFKTVLCVALCECVLPVCVCV